MNIIGLGKAGCAIADGFAQYPEYNIYKIDVNISGERCLSIKKQQGPEDYESKCPSLKTFFKNVKGDTIVVIGG